MSILCLRANRIPDAGLNITQSEQKTDLKFINLSSLNFKRLILIHTLIFFFWVLTF